MATDITSKITLGILGGGQLGRMSALAAARLGISVITLTPERDSPAVQVSSRAIEASYTDEAALKSLSDACDFITYEFENIPLETIEFLETLKPNSVYPDYRLLEVSQDRIREKQFLNDLNIPTAFWFEVNNLNDIQACLNKIPTQTFILKTSRFGYDGKGQIKCDKSDILQNKNLATFFGNHPNAAFILESMVPFTHEISVIIARDLTGKSVTYGAMLNTHKNHILHETIIPAPLAQNTLDNATAIAIKVADAVNLVGVLTVELFVCADGSILANEIAPRTHNSGHWSIDACTVSQFENHVRAVCGLAVCDPLRHSDARMLNIIGDDMMNADTYMTQSGACLHLYGKHEMRAGRKMGHVTFLTPRKE